MIRPTDEDPAARDWHKCHDAAQERAQAEGLKPPMDAAPRQESMMPIEALKQIAVLRSAIQSMVSLGGRAGGAEYARKMGEAVLTIGAQVPEIDAPEIEEAMGAVERPVDDPLLLYQAARLLVKNFIIIRRPSP